MRFSLIVLILLAAAAAAFVAAPWFAFRSLRDAARTGDVSALADLVDYRALRENFAAELSGRAPEPPAPDVMSDPVGALQAFLKPRPQAPPTAQHYLEPDAIAALADGRPPGAPLPAGAPEPFPTVAFWGPDRCRIVVKDPQAPTRRTEFTFRRHGVYSWKLTRVVWPELAKARAQQTH